VRKLQLWQQATTEITQLDHSIFACSHHIYTGVILCAHPILGELHNGVTRGLSQGEYLAERGSLATVWSPLANTQKTNLREMVNLDVDDDSETLNHWKILGKTQKNNNLLKTKRKLKP